MTALPKAPFALEDCTSALVMDASGIWVSREEAAKGIRFPEHGHDACFRVEDGSFWFSHRNECIASALARYPFFGAFLDVGGGNGAVSAALEKRGFRTVLLEPGRDGAKNAKERGLASVICATLDQAQFHDGSFGGAGLFDVIEHIEDDEAILRGVHRVLTPRGSLCVTVPAHAWLWSAEDELAGHCRRYTVKSARAVVERCGFEVLYASYFFAPLTLPVFFARSLRHRLSKKRALDASEVEANAAEQHAPSEMSRRAMEMLLKPEIQRIREGRTIRTGTSILLVARARVIPGRHAPPRPEKV